jgi:hypothetical protein
VIESALEEFACDLAEKDGWIVRKLRWIGRRNGMDRFFLKEGRIVLCEFKRPGEAPIGGQLKEIEAFRAAGAEVYVVDNPLTILRQLGVVYENA